MEELEALLIDPEFSEVTTELESLRELNALAYNVMSSTRGYPGHKFSAVRYKHLQHTYSWLIARAINLTIRLKLHGKLVCDYCDKEIIVKEGNKGFTMHHEINYYNHRELYSPNLLWFVHASCHAKIHQKPNNF